MSDLGEDVFPEPPHIDAAKSGTATGAADAVESVESMTPEAAGTPQHSESEEKKVVTTQERKPLEVPSSVHLTIAAENLKEYVGPQIYHKDRFYTKAPPAGVSTGLGYLGNGSGAVMPVEAMVCGPLLRCDLLMDLTLS